MFYYWKKDDEQFGGNSIAARYGLRVHAASNSQSEIVVVDSRVETKSEVGTEVSCSWWINSDSGFSDKKVAGTSARNCKRISC